MKHLKLFLALLALVGVSLTADAQTWTGSAPENGKIYYLYNVGKGFYLTGDNDWGTHASCTRYGIDFTLAQISDGVFTLDSQISNGGDSHYLNANYVDGSVQNWTFTATGDADNSYFLNNGSGNLYAVSSSTLVEVGDVSDSYAKWILLTKEDITMQMRSATKDNPVDITVLIKNANRSRNNLRNDNSWTVTKSGGNWNTNQWGNYPAIESWNNTFEYSQELTDMPLGDYKIGCAGFGTNGTTKLFINEGETVLQNQSISSSHGSNYAAAAQSIHEEETGIMGNISDMITVTSSTLKLGLKRSTNKSTDWAVFDKLNLMYYGLDLSSFETALADAVVAAQALEGTIPQAAYDNLSAIVANNNNTYTTIDDYTAATQAIIEATNAAKALQTPYSNYKNARANVVALKSQTTYTDEGGAAAAQLDTDVAAADAANETATTIEGINAAIQQVRTAAGTFAGSVTVNKGQYLDLTDAMLFNAAMRETGGLSLWNIVSNSNSNYPKYNGSCSEFWNANFEFNQTAYNLPAGNYNIEVFAFHRAGTYNTYLYANDDKILVLPITNGENSMDAAAAAFDQGLYLNSLKITLEAAGNVVIGFKNEDGDETDKWTIFRDFKIKYFGDDALAVFREEYESALAEAETALASGDYTNIIGEEKTALNTAVTETYPKTVVEVDETQEKFETATAALKEVTTTFKNAKAAYDAFVAAKAAAANNKVDYPYASAEKLAAYQENLTTNATSAANATEKTAAIVSLYRTYVESNALAEGVEGAADLTDKIKQTAIADWTAEITGSDKKFVLKNADGNDADTYTAADGTKGKNLIDSGDLWGAASWTAKMTQTITLTAGKYVLTAAARGSNDLSTFKLLADDKSVDMGHTGAAVGNGVFDRGFNDYYVEFEVTDYSKDVTIGFEAATEIEHNWCSVARFRLAQIEDNVEWATEEELNAYIDALQAKTLGFEEGEYAPYVNAESVLALQNISSAVDAVFASSFDGNHVPKQTLEYAIEQINALEWTANTEEVNAFFDGAFASEYSHEGNVMPIGWHAGDGVSDNATNMRLMWNSESNAGLNATSSKQGAFAKFTALYGTEPGYTLPLKAGVYSLKFIFGGWNEKATREIKVYNAENVAVVTPSSITAKDNKAHTTVDSWSTFEGFVTIPADGDYTFSFYRQSTSAQNQLVFSDITLFKAKPETVTIKAGRQYTAFSSAMPLDFTDTGLKAEIVVSETGQTQEVTKVPANTGVIVGLAAPATELTEISVPVCAGETDDVTANKLVAVVESATVQQVDGDNTNYVFGKKNGKEAFYKVVAAGMTVPAHNAYLAIPTAAGAKEVIFLGGETTGVSHVDADAVEGDIYTVSGVKVQKAQKGVYIQNGKKVIVK